MANWVQVALDRGFANNEPVAAIAPTASYSYTDEALKHLAEAKARRANPTASESKRPGAVDTAAHCERLAALGRTAIIAPSVTSAAPVNSEAADAPSRSGGPPSGADSFGFEAARRR